MSNCQYSIFEYIKIKSSFIEGDFTDYRTRIRNLREDRDLTQSEVGKVIQKSQQGYNHIEAGRAELKIDDLITLCKFYNVSSDYIIGLSDNPNPTPK